MFEKKLANNSKNNPKPIWSYVKSKLKGSKACTSKEKADVLNAYFGNVYKEETGELPQHKYYSGIPLTREMVLEKLNSLNPGKSMGLDG